MGAITGASPATKIKREKGVALIPHFARQLRDGTACRGIWLNLASVFAAVKLVRVLRASSSKPCCEIRRGRFVDHIQCSLVVPSDPVEVCASLQQVLRCIPLTTMAGTPEGLGDQLKIWARSFSKGSLDPVQQPEGSSLAQPGARPSLDQSSGRCPIAESTSVG
jgi:hypothetical protein